MSELSKSLGAGRGTAMMLNIVLGAGLLTLPGLAAKTAGSAALLVWGACALAAAPLLLVFALLGRMHPDAGGIASVMKTAFGPAGHVSATFLFLGAVVVGLPAIAITGGHYAAEILGGSPYLYAGFLVVAATLSNLLSTEIASRINTVIASLVLIFIVGIGGFGWIAVSPTWADIEIVPADLPGIPILGLTFMMVFFAFTGWEVSANLSEEFRNPKRDFPVAMGLSFAIAVALYFLLAIVVAASGRSSAVEAPFAQIFRQEFGSGGANAVAVGAVVMIFANLSAAIWAVSRMLFSASRERLIVSRLSRLRSGVPLNAVAVTMGALLVVVGLAAFGLLDLERLLAIAGQNFLLLYAGAAAALMRLSTARWQCGLGGACIVLAGVLILGRGVDDIVYPAILMVLGIIVSFRAPSMARKAA